MLLLNDNIGVDKIHAQRFGQKNAQGAFARACHAD